MERRREQRDAGVLRGCRGELATRLALLARCDGGRRGITPAAAGHSIVLPFTSRPADLQLYTVIVPTETDSPTKEVAAEVPEGIDFLLVKETPGWKVDVQRNNDRST